MSFYYKEGKGKKGQIGSNTIICLDNDSTAESVPFRVAFQDAHVIITSVAMQCTKRALYHYMPLPHIFQFDNLIIKSWFNSTSHMIR